MQSSPGRSQGSRSRDDVPMTDQTDYEPYEVSSSRLYIFSMTSIDHPSHTIFGSHHGSEHLTNGLSCVG